MSTPDSKFARRPSQEDRLPPHSEPAERALLGCMLLDESQIPVVQAALGAAKGEAFYDIRHQAVYGAVLDSRDAGQRPDPVALSVRMKGGGLLDSLGGVGYLLSLCDAPVSPANAPEYARIVAECHTKRRLIQLCRVTVERTLDHGGGIEELLDTWEREALAVGAGRVLMREADIRAIQQRLTSAYEDAIQRRTPMGLLSGYDDLDRVAGGMMPKELIVVGGTPSSGKTTLALCIAARVARSGTPVSFYSGETSAEKLVHRLHCMEGRVDGEKFLRGDVTEGEFASMASGMASVVGYRSRLRIHDGPLGQDLIAKARGDWQQGSRLFIVDYLQLVAADGRNEFERVTNASRFFKRMAKELDSAVVVVSSLSRPEKGSSRKPKTSDLRQSGQIEYDADKIILLHCDDAERDKDVREVDLHVAKNKDGRTGSINMVMFAAQFRMESAARGGAVESQPRGTEDYAPDAR